MPKPKRSATSWFDHAVDAVTRYGLHLRNEWRRGEVEVLRGGKEPPPASPTKEKGRRAPEVECWWDVLQVARTASKEEIRRAYRRLIKANHPDKSAHLSAEAQAALERRAKQLNDAYERALEDS